MKPKERQTLNVTIKTYTVIIGCKCLRGKHKKGGRVDVGEGGGLRRGPLPTHKTKEKPSDLFCGVRA